MVLNQYMLDRAREDQERIAVELEREREARRAAETKADAAQTKAEAAQTKAEAAETKAEAAQRRSDRLAAALLASLKDKGIDPEVLDALLEE